MMLDKDTAIKIVRAFIAAAALLALLKGALDLAIIIAFVLLFALIFPRVIDGLIARLGSFATP